MRNINQLTSRHFETFTSVVKAGSFTTAAKELKTSKAAVSQTVRMIEETLGVPLLIRSTRKLSLTDEGILLFSQCEKLQTELNITRNIIGNFKEKPSGTLRINCNTHIANTHLLPIVDQYLKKFPDVNIEIITDERILDMKKEKIDIILCINYPALNDDVVARKIAKTRYVLCASPEYLKQFGTPKTLKELEQHQYIPHSGRSPENLIQDTKKSKNLRFNPRLSINSSYLMKQCALKSLGITQVHEYFIKEELENGRLIEVLKNEIKSEVPLYMYYQKHQFVQPKIRQFVNIILAQPTTTHLSP